MSQIELPSDVYTEILLKLDSKSLKHFCQTNTQTRKICNNEAFWKDKIIYDFDLILANQPKYIQKILTSEQVLSPLRPKNVNYDKYYFDLINGDYKFIFFDLGGVVKTNKMVLHSLNKDQYIDELGRNIVKVMQRHDPTIINVYIHLQDEDGNLIDYYPTNKGIHQTFGMLPENVWERLSLIEIYKY